MENQKALKDIKYNHLAYSLKNGSLYLRITNGVVNLESSVYYGIHLYDKDGDYYIDLGELNIDVVREVKYGVNVKVG